MDAALLSQAREALINGKVFLEAHDWARFHSICRTSGGRWGFCAEGAVKYGAFWQREKNGIGDATFTPPATPLAAEIYEAAIKLLDRAASKAVGKDVYIQEYNDYIARRKEEILALFGLAIEGTLNEDEAGTFRDSSYPHPGGGSSPEESGGVPKEESRGTEGETRSE